MSWSETRTLPSLDARRCLTCGQALRADAEFCYSCGHAIDYRGEHSRVELDGELDANAGDICPACGATHMIVQEQGFPQCESCGYTERH